MELAIRQHRIPPDADCLAGLALHNIAVHRALPAPADATLNVANAFRLTAFAGRSRCSQIDLGIRIEDLRCGLRTGSVPPQWQRAP